MWVAFSGAGDIGFEDPVPPAVEAVKAVQAGAQAATSSQRADRRGRPPITPALLQAASNAAWRAYWARGGCVSLPASPLTERFFFSSLYLLRLSAGGRTPPGLFGEVCECLTPRVGEC